MRFYRIVIFFEWGFKWTFFIFNFKKCIIHVEILIMLPDTLKMVLNAFYPLEGKISQ